MTGAGLRRGDYRSAGMAALSTFFAVTWLVFWGYWMVSATGAKRGTRRGLASRLPFVVTAALVVLLLRGAHAGGLEVHALVLRCVGVVLFLAGLGLAVWARVHLGRNWGMPMTRKDEPELVTSGPYGRVRHPIYSGLLLAMLGTALATTLYWLIAFVTLGAYFLFSARVEERMLEGEFPEAYPGYRAHTKMLIPFLL
jgi:protein-S-isoprenylcysteine O-methyltransferase Ste14